MSDAATRTEITILGTVQGVGFRPFVYRLARRYNLVGSILNSDQGVLIELEGSENSIRIFTETLRATPPPLAQISSWQEEKRSNLKGFTEFSILQSISTHKSRVVIPPDIATCLDCSQDIADPENRRYQYPFTNCTNCGPRFSIVTSTPYDRPGTSMKKFPLCAACAAEYNDPENRRFHAQPNACEQCGPALSYHNNKGEALAVDSVLEAVARDLKQGKIVAMRGLGGFHLVVDARCDKAIKNLRKRKGRKSKPLAVMSADLQEASIFAHISEEDKVALQGVEHPIVLLPYTKSKLGSSLTPNISEIGLMLPYTPLHQLLFLQKECPQTLVMTSGNRSEKPIFTSNAEALEGIQDIADSFLLHNRDIVTRIDDSVVRTTPRGIQIIRHARGYVPSATILPDTFPDMLACGAGRKSTFCLTRGREGFLSQHIGNLFNLESLDFYKESIYHFITLLQVELEAVVCDLHPDYLSTHYAVKSGLPLYKVQHHHAHAAAVLVEHGIQGKVLALILDGSGLGDDNTLWGGEVLVADCKQYTRRGSLAPMLLPGGDAATESPWRMALSLLSHAHIEADASGLLRSVDAKKRNGVLQLMEKGFNCPLTTSCGRLFDGIAALLGICFESDFEGQAAMELESLAHQATHNRPLAELLADSNDSATISKANDRHVLQQKELIIRVVEQINAGIDSAAIALDFHLCLIQSFSALLCTLGKQTGLKTVVLSGGCMQNMLLQNGLFILLEKKGYTVYTGEKIPVNDGGIALGQAVIGGFAHVSGSTNESS
jgi:hydrogenase maturation protein HypF